MIGLSEELIDSLKHIFNTYNEIECVVLFGSRAKGNFKENSDIDLAIFGEINDLVIENIASQLNELPTPYKFDVIGFNSISNKSLREHITRVGITIYQK